MNNIKIPIFNQRIYIVNKEYAKKYCGDIEIYKAVCFYGDRDKICIYIGDAKDDDIVHESVHLANFVINRCLLHSTTNEDEILAYLTGYIYKKLLTYL